MEIEEFNKTGFSALDKIIYKGKTYDLAGADFDENLIGFYYYGDEEKTWVRCENVTWIEGVKIPCKDCKEIHCTCSPF